jgi:hypothetical protein
MNARDKSVARPRAYGKDLIFMGPGTKLIRRSCRGSAEEARGTMPLLLSPFYGENVNSCPGKLDEWGGLLLRECVI